MCRVSIPVQCCAAGARGNTSTNNFNRRIQASRTKGATCVPIVSMALMSFA
jgi:hypothetical protein